ncbi:cytochrome c [candidate division KSB1 bacterium]|nr:cytochrome c [candidate division KSB1 bacterium]NIV69634.1 hypothetical protein [Phycisphaerae bacterium]NIR70373.1 cytochrome c [candidate division KSB1 bacterium]NIS24497.1 cytochrome c [candidate division KSB1 bacterium]NIT71425.1 cytochrome c [candidate division KSB1 bacterium]
MSKLVLGIVMILFITACSNEQTTAPPQDIQPTLSSIQTNIFSTTCAVPGCHVPGGAGPMPLRNVNESFQNLVGVASVQIPALIRVQPNDADNSYLIRKLEGGPGIAGRRMPLGRAPLSNEEISAIRQWINNGALNN